MALPPVRPIISWGIKALWYLAETALTGVLWDKFDEANEIQPSGGTLEEPGANSWRHWSLRWDNVITGDTADAQVFGLDIVNLTSGQVDPTWTQGDYDTVIGHLSTFYSGISAHVSSNYSLGQVAAYVKAFRPYDDPKPFVDSGAPDIEWAGNVAGSGLPGLPPQNCTTVTEQTPSRANWGRFYLPTLGMAELTSVGRLDSAKAGQIITLANTLFENLANAQFPVVVPTTSSGSTKTTFVPKRTLQAVTAVSIDDVVDIQRRRRYAAPLFNQVQPVAQTQTLPAGELDDVAA